MIIMKTFFSNIFVVIFVMTVVSAYTDQGKHQFLDRMTVQADEAETQFDKLRFGYCNVYRDLFAQKTSAWPTVKRQCLESAALELENLDQNDDLFYIKQENNAMAMEMYAKCGKLATDPCDDINWIKIKKCLRDVYLAVPKFKANSISLTIGDELVPLGDDILQGMNIDKVVSDRTMMLALLESTELAKCTGKIFKVSSS